MSLERTGATPSAVVLAPLKPKTIVWSSSVQPWDDIDPCPARIYAQSLFRTYETRNLGPRSREMLAKAGIVSDRELKALGAVAAFVAVKRAGGKPSLNLLWALEGALTDCDWTEVAKNDRLSLLSQLEAAEARRKA